MVRLTDRPDMTLDVYRGRKTTMQQIKKTLTSPGGMANVRLSTALILPNFLVL